MRRILFLATGGTISCAETEAGLAPKLGMERLLSSVPLGEIEIRADGEQMFMLDSTNMTPRHWEAIAKRIRESYNDYDGFVIAHGTDTLGYAAASLSCLIQNSRKPVVLTGSMLPMLAKNSDAPRNLRDAFAFAADERAFGVRVVFFGEIIDGRCVVKTDTETVDAFDSLHYYGTCPGDITEDGKVIFNEKYHGETRFYERLSDGVFLAKLIPGQELLIPENARAVILESYGDGGIPDYCMNEVKRLANKGVYFIVATQCFYGFTDLQRYEVGRVAAERFNLLETYKMTVEYAVARARWALEYSNGFEEFKRLFYDIEFLNTLEKRIWVDDHKL